MRGIRRTISISKTRKIIVRRKKRIENGIRADFIGSKPHSKGESLSRSIDERWEIISEASRTKVGTTVARVKT